jgi:hypothetical protein
VVVRATSVALRRCAGGMTGRPPLRGAGGPGSDASR